MPLNTFEKDAPAPLPLPLREEADVMKTWGLLGTPVVSICCATFNHAQYIEDTLRGFLGQVTSFPFEIVVRDDASTDGTTEILANYAAKYPSIIRSVVEKENQHSKGIRANPALVPLAKGEYIALCEGDDYWICPDKLEKQVSLLKNKTNATMSVAQTVVCRVESGKLVCGNSFLGNDKDLQYFDDVKNTYFHTSTYLIRTETYRNVLSKYANKIEYGDTALRYMLIDIGPFVLLKEVVSVYRVTGSGIWTSLSRPKQLAWEIKAIEGLYKHLDAKYRSHFGVKLFYLYIQMARQNVWSFNNKSWLVNSIRLLFFSAKYGVFLTWGSLVKRARKMIALAD